MKPHAPSPSLSRIIPSPAGCSEGKRRDFPAVPVSECGVLLPSCGPSCTGTNPGKKHPGRHISIGKPDRQNTSNPGKCSALSCAWYQPHTKSGLWKTSGKHTENKQKTHRKQTENKQKTENKQNNLSNPQPNRRCVLAELHLRKVQDLLCH